jgi:Nuclease A inhibitor-like protein
MKKDEALKGGGAADETASLSQKLASLTKGLLFMSESDYPLEPFVFEKGGAAATARDAAVEKGADSKAEFKELNFDSFFGNATREQDWQGEEARATVKKFQALVGFLKESLSDIKVYRVGGVDADVYVVGHTKSGGFAGVKTKVVET